MNGFLVDTNVISEILRPAPDAHVAAWSQRTARPMLFLSVVSMGELRKGVTILPASARRGIHSTRGQPGAKRALAIQDRRFIQTILELNVS
jgi:predicted nucleic acid-binding protein